ncbi:hypothetical protein [Streptomyces mangrovisoli]|nr:hypothetical protein [Streptomyces mangrovisoli]
MSTPQEAAPADRQQGQPQERRDERQQDAQPPYVPTAQAPSMPSLTATAPATGFSNPQTAWALDLSSLFPTAVGQGVGRYSPFDTDRQPAPRAERPTSGQEPSHPVPAVPRGNPAQDGQKAKRR